VTYQPVAVITGAGCGLGAAMARRLAREGYAVAVTDIDADRAAAVAAELHAAGARGIALKVDVTLQQDWDVLAQRVIAEWGGCNVLINNAGVAVAGRCDETPLADWQWVMDVDLMGVVRGCHRFLPMLREEAARGGPAHIVNLASFAGFSAMPGIAAYGTAKAGVIALSEFLLTELAGSGVGVSVVCPSFVKTNLLDSFRSIDPAWRRRVERWMNQSEVTAEDVADDVLEALRRRRFLVLTHRRSRWALRLKRWWPGRYYRTVSRLAGEARRAAA
jgi:NADP-dependent 3-hydroxy acid dehydrogenase YdfG